MTFSAWNRLKSLIGRRRLTAEQARAMLFPEYQLSDESEALFDPFTLRLKHVPRPDIKAEVELIGEGKLDAAANIVRPKAARLGDEMRLRYLFGVTAGVHELRHFHDHFGTTFGFERIKRRIHDGIAFAKMWETLGAHTEIKLPIAAWAARPDAPEPVREYMTERRRFVEWFHVHDAVQLPAKPGERYATVPESMDPHIVLAYQLKGLQAVIPTVVLRNGRGQKVIVPMGGRVLMEGSAFIVQRHLATNLLGSSTHKEMIGWMQSATRDDPTRIERMLPYMAIDLYLSQRLEKFFDRYQLAVADTAMMPGANQLYADTHPGLRITKLVAQAKAQKSRRPLSGTNLTNAMRELTKSLGWPHARFVASQAADESTQILAELEKSGSQAFWFQIQRALVKIHLDLMQLRQKVPDLLADPEIYLRSYAMLIPPPISWRGENLEFKGFTGDLPALQGWYHFAYFQNQLLFGSHMRCVAQAQDHVCPGDPWAHRHWAPLATCPFSRFLDSMGLPGKRPVWIN